MFTSIFPGNWFLFHWGSYLFRSYVAQIGIECLFMPARTNHVWRIIYQWQTNYWLTAKVSLWVGGALLFIFLCRWHIICKSFQPMRSRGLWHKKSISNTAVQKESQETFTNYTCTYISTKAQTIWWLNPSNLVYETTLYLLDNKLSL